MSMEIQINQKLVYVNIEYFYWSLTLLSFLSWVDHIILMVYWIPFKIERKNNPHMCYILFSSIFDIISPTLTYNHYVIHKAKN